MEQQLQHPQLQWEGDQREAAGLPRRLHWSPQTGVRHRCADHQQPLPHECLLWYDFSQWKKPPFISLMTFQFISLRVVPQAAWWWSWRTESASWRAGQTAKASSLWVLPERSALDPTSMLSGPYQTHRFVFNHSASLIYTVLSLERSLTNAPVALQDGMKMCMFMQNTLTRLLR